LWPRCKPLMKPPWAVRCITRSCTGLCIAKGGARSCRGPVIPKGTRPRAAFKKMPETIQQHVEQSAESGRPVRLLFEDEARFGRISDPRRCWAPPGVRPEVNTQWIREYEYAFAAVSPQDGTLDTLALPTVNAEAMSVFLPEVSRRHRDELLLLVLDGAGWPRAKRLQVPAHMRLIFLPPWSPQLNPVEHVWDEVREKWFANRVFASMEAVENQLVTALATWEADAPRVPSRTGFDWIKSIPLNAH
jgi:transposase